MKSVLIDLTGKRFGAWTVLKHLGRDQCRQTKWLCLCDCGTQKEVDGNSLKQGKSTNCGCLKAKKSKERFTTHGASKSATYKIWADMRKRCGENATGHAYKYYVRYGVKVCERWSSFENFLADMGERPEGKSIDRYPDPFGDYEPSNCRWATASEQAYNRRPMQKGIHKRGPYKSMPPRNSKGVFVKR